MTSPQEKSDSKSFDEELNEFDAMAVRTAQITIAAAACVLLVAVTSYIVTAHDSYRQCAEQLRQHGANDAKIHAICGSAP